MAASPSPMQQMYLNECNAALNTQIQVQLYAAYIYLSMAYFCNQDEVALGYFALFFLRQSQKWMERTEMLFVLLTERGGFLNLGRIASQDHHHNWFDGFLAMDCAFHLEKKLNESLLQLYQVAESRGDIFLCNMLKRHFLQKQVEVLKEMGGYLTNLRRIGAPENHEAEHIFEELTLAESTKED